MFKNKKNMFKKRKNIDQKYILKTFNKLKNKFDNLKEMNLISPNKHLTFFSNLSSFKNHDFIYFLNLLENLEYNDLIELYKLNENDFSIYIFNKYKIHLDIHYDYYSTLIEIHLLSIKQHKTIMDLSKKHQTDFVPYPDINDADFFKKINAKKEFNENVIEKINNKKISDFCSYDEKISVKTLTNQQKTLKNYINPVTPYKNLLIFHGTGAGKTCTVISIAENHLEYGSKKVILLAQGDTIYGNLKKELYDYSEENKEIDKGLAVGSLQCTKDKYYIPKGNLTDEERDKLTIKKIKKNYDLFKTSELINVVKDIQVKYKNSIEIKKHIVEKFDNRLLVIDECHELRKKHDDVDNDLNIKILSTLEFILENCKNIKLILMSATPMYDSPDEIIDIINLFRINNGKNKIDKNEIFDKDLKIKQDGFKLLDYNFKGIISYYKGYNPVSFPLIINPDDPINKNLYNVNMYIPKNTRDYKGDILKVNDRIKYINLTKCKMTKFQEKHYFSELKDITSDIAFKNSSDLMNFIFPIDNSDNIGYGGNGFKNAFRNLQNNKYAYKHFNEGFLNINNLERYSTKYFNIANNVVKSTGLVFVNFIYKYATKTMGMVLEELGYLPYKGGNLLYNPINKKKLCALCNKYSDNNIHENKKLKNYHTFKQARYVIITGDVLLNEREKIINVTKSSSNKYGEKCKVIIGSKVMNQGVDFKNIRQIHIGNPWHNMSQITQIIGRGSRFCGHIDLKDNERNVTIFKYSCSTNDGITETIDEKLWRTAESKDIVIKEIERIMKENAIDCLFNKNANYFDPKDFKNMKLLDNTAECDYTSCEIKCKNNEIGNDETTYNYVELKNDKKQEIEYYIKNYIEKHKYISVDRILNKYNNYGKNITNYVINKIIAFDKSSYPLTVTHNNDVGFLKLINNNLVFNSYDNLTDKINIFNYDNNKSRIEIKLEKINKNVKKESKEVNTKKIIDELTDVDLETCYFLLENKYFSAKVQIMNFLLKILIDNEMTKLNMIDKKYKNLILFFEKYFIKKKFISENPHDEKYTGFYYNHKYFCSNFKECNFEENRLIDKNFYQYMVNSLNLNKKEADVIGFIVIDKNKSHFKIIDKLSEKTKKRLDDKIMKTTLNKGKVCFTYEKDDLVKFAKYLEIELSTTKPKPNRNLICKLIQLKLIENNNKNKDGLRWFYTSDEINVKNMVDNENKN